MQRGAVLWAVVLCAAATLVDAKEVELTCADRELAALPFCDASLPPEQRVSDLLTRLTPAEKVSQLVMTAAAVPRLGMRQFSMAAEALHGVWSACVDGRCPTQFPAPVAMAASFDQELWSEIGAATAREARALFNSGSPSARGLEGQLGLTFYAPTLNVIRDPRWGRVEEAISEDPVVTGALGAAFVHGMQTGAPIHAAHAGGNNNTWTNTRYWAVAAVAKCFAEYSLDCVQLDAPHKACADHFPTPYAGDRHSFNAHIPAQDLVETYLVPWRRVSGEGGVAGVMCSYQAINGKPACASPLIQSVLRGGLGYRGFLASDCGAVEQIAAPFHNYTATLADAVVEAVRAGVDSTCGWEFTHATGGVMAAVARGSLSLADVDRMAARVLLVRVKTGLFDPVEDVEYHRWRVNSSVDTRRHRALARRAARESVVLLRNDGNGLPLDARQALGACVCVCVCVCV